MARKILVTGTRGKSTLVRMLTGAFRTAGIPCWSRITGVIPTEFSPQGARRIERSSPASVEELRWWLGTIPSDADAVVAENSAVAPELQGLSGRWLVPDLLIWTNALADHQEVWGPGKEDALCVLREGIPPQTACLLGPELSKDQVLREYLRSRGCELFTASGVGGLEGLAIRALQILGVDVPGIDPALVPEDPGAFRILCRDGGKLAFAFAANEPETTELLWKSTGWIMEETTLLFNHRRDRAGRLQAFLPFLGSEGWKDVLITGANPLRRCGRARFIPLAPGELESLICDRGRVFGCGNVAGLPLRYLEEAVKEVPCWNVR